MKIKMILVALALGLVPMALMADSGTFEITSTSSSFPIKIAKHGQIEIDTEAGTWKMPDPEDDRVGQLTPSPSGSSSQWIISYKGKPYGTLTHISGRIYRATFISSDDVQFDQTNYRLAPKFNQMEAPSNTIGENPFLMILLSF